MYQGLQPPLAAVELAKTEILGSCTYAFGIKLLVNSTVKTREIII
jgi:hypothetical protein